MLLNCDLGESFGAWQMGLDSHAMAVIDCANIACGFHAGDADVMASTLQLAKQHNVMVGAHPSYPDKQGFGRRSMAMSQQELINCLHYQIAALDGMATSHGVSVSYVKPHGALYNDMMAQPDVLNSVMRAVSSYHKPLKLMLLATNQQAEHTELAKAFGLGLLFEAFADRLYTDQGTLTPRSEPNAVHNKSALIAQVKQLLSTGTVTTGSGKQLALQADTLCVHGDNEASIAQVQEIKALIESQ